MKQLGRYRQVGFSLWLLAGLTARAGVFSEDFATHPLQNGWGIAGDNSLFQWNSTNQNVEVTWDSSRTNSYFYRRLGTVLTKSDTFSLEFDLRLRDIAIGVNTNKPYTFELAVGLLHFQSATNASFFRGAGINATYGPRNLVEFDYFPDSGFGATVAPTVVSTNNRIRFSDNHPLELAPDDWFHISMSYTPGNELLRTSLTRNGSPFGLPPGDSIHDLSLSGFPDFRVDTFAVMSYSDAGQGPPQFAGSILAHGILDNIRWNVPEPAVADIRGEFVDGIWEVSFTGRTNWTYSLERTSDFASWHAVVTDAAGQGGVMRLRDAAATLARTEFYRVRAERP